MWNLKYNSNDLIYKTKTGSQTKKTNDDSYQGVWGRDKLGVWD